MTDINVGHAVLVIGDTDTVDRAELLAEQAAEKGLRIAQTFAFHPGEAASHDDLTEVDEVVAALSQAIVTRTDLWCPFPLQDLCREAHFRRLSLALQRHGLNLLMGPELEPSPTEGGYHEIDAALRKEVHAVDELDNAALASAGLRILGAEIEAALADVPEQPATSWAHDDLIHAWWVIPGTLLAGEYPGAKQQHLAGRKLKTLLAGGVDSFVNLTQAGEKTWGGAPLVPYHRGLPARHRRFPIPDNGVISDAGYDEILEYIRDEIAAGRVVYVHCWGGKGRTGTVVGAWLIEQEGLGYPEVLDRLQELRAGTRKAHHRVPDTHDQARVLKHRARAKGA
jgi:hypothetical protein